ncbi:cytochrome P450 86B1-like [Hibiscus syriacus]|uniref:Cytochrome P450 86B1-like n=1 Tax=Hibiscus syriacus TaxID=106335 RepID=A0A6A2ZCQ5_HIBSY|nr:cytochrome P450 86B1-like [Hibiscus syriacus]
MATTVENAIAKAAEEVIDGKETNGSEAANKEEEVAVEVEPKTGVPFPVKLDDGKQLNCVGVRKKSILRMGIKIYGFGKDNGFRRVGMVDELLNSLGEVSDNIKLTSGSLIEISRLPVYVLKMKVMGEVISKVESELLCRSYINLYLGDDPLDKDAKDKFGMSLISLF